MKHQRITHLRFASGGDAAKACERLAAAVTGHAERASLRVLRADDQRVVLVVGAADPETLTRLDDAVLVPWLATLSLAELARTVIGETVWTHEAGDPWAHVDTLDEVARCEHFVHHVVESGSAWGLYDKTWARSMAVPGREALPLWPSRELAARCVAGPWRTFTPRAIELAVLADDWLTGMAEDGIVAVVTPTPRDPGVPLDPDVLAEALLRASPR